MRWVFLLPPALLALFVANGAQANTSRVTRGDAEALFQSYAGAGWAIQLHNADSEGAPAEFMPTDNVRIAPQPAAFNGKHYCSLDWHVIALALNEGRRAGETLSNQQLFDRLAARQITFNLDGVPLSTERTDPRRMLNPGLRGWETAFFVVIGRVMAPEDISVGQHTLQGFSETGASIGSITFFIDAPGSGVCGPDDALTFREVE